MAKYEVRFHPSSIQEAEASQIWYAKRSQAAAIGFTNEVSSAIEKILESPSRWPKYQKIPVDIYFPGFPSV